MSMSRPEAAAERLHALYVEELERVLAPPVHPMVDERQTRALIRMAHAAARCVRSTGCNDLDLVGPAPGAQGLTRGLLQAVRNGALGGPGDDGRLVRPGRRRRHDHLPGRRQRRRQRPGPPPAGGGGRRPGSSGSCSGTTRSIARARSTSTASTRFTARCTPLGTRVRGHKNVRKRVLIQAAACNIGLLLRRQTGIGTLRSLQGRAVSAICRLIGRLIDRWGRLTRAWGFKWTPTALVGSIAHRQAA